MFVFFLGCFTTAAGIVIAFAAGSVEQWRRCDRLGGIWRHSGCQTSAHVLRRNAVFVEGEGCMLKKSIANPSTSTVGDLELEAACGKKHGDVSGEEVLDLGKNSLAEVDQGVCDCLQEASS